MVKYDIVGDLIRPLINDAIQNVFCVVSFEMD